MLSSPLRVSDPDMHHDTCVMHVRWCMSGPLNSGFLWSQRWVKRSWHPRRIRNPQCCLSGKRPMGLHIVSQRTHYAIMTQRLRIHYVNTTSATSCWRCEYVIFASRARWGWSFQDGRYDTEFIRPALIVGPADIEAELYEQVTQDGVFSIEDSLSQIATLGRRYVLDHARQPGEIKEYLHQLDIGCNLYKVRYGYCNFSP